MYHDVSRYIDTTRYTDTHVSPPLRLLVAGVRRPAADSPGVGFWASSELLEFYYTPNMHQAFSFLDRFLAKSSPFFSILPNFYFAPRSAAQLAHESR